MIKYSGNLIMKNIGGKNMKKIIAIGIIGMFLLSSFMITSASENKLIGVLNGGNTLYVGGSGPGNYTVIQDAINDSSDGDTVFVYSGTYSENVWVNKSITLKGESKDNTTINGSVIVIEAFVNLSGFKIESDSWWGGIYIEFTGSKHGFNFITDNIIIMNNSGAGIFIQSNSSTGSKTYISKNIIINGSAGIFILNCKDIHIIDNIIKNNTEGIAIGAGGDYGSSSGNFVIGNTISSNHEFGISLGCSCYNNTIYHNNFINNTKHAGAKESNYWNESYPIGGNYWDNYTGEDDDGDGLGDTPYNISSSEKYNNTDYYPLMQPFGSVELSIKIAPFDFGKISAFIRNKESVSFSNIEWNVSVTGGILGLLNISANGTIETLDPGMSEKVTTGFNSIVRRLGKVTITVEVKAGPYSFTQTFYGFVLGRLFIDRTYQILNS